MSEESGSFLVSGTPAADPAAAAGAAVAAGVAADGQPAPAPDGPPEWAVAKFWSKDKPIDEYAKAVSQGYRSAESYLGKEKAPIVTNWDDPDQVEMWFKAAGRPEKADDYEFKRPTLPEDLPYDEEEEKNFRQWAHANGFNKKQAANLYDAVVKTRVEKHAAWSESRKRERAELDAALVREHGGNIEGVKQGALTVMQKYADDQFRQYLDQTGLGNDPRMVRVLAKIHKDLNGDTRLKGATAPAPNQGDMRAQISDFRARHDKALMDKGHPEHNRVVSELERMYHAAFPEQR
jgi:hypothetical protein